MSTTAKKLSVKEVAKLINIISDSGIRELHSNGGKHQQILFKIGDNKYRIDIKSESVQAQCFATLSAWTTEKGFSTVINKNPKRDYGIDLAYLPTERYSQDAFAVIISELKRVAIDFN